MKKLPLKFGIFAFLYRKMYKQTDILCYPKQKQSRKYIAESTNAETTLRVWW